MNGALRLADPAAFLLNPWALLQFAHNQAASVATASFVVAGASAAASAILFITLPSTDVKLAPMTTGTAGLTLSGAF